MIIKILTTFLVICSFLISCQHSSEIVTQKPDEKRFLKTVLDAGLDEPMELAIAKDGRVVFVERKGNIKLFIPTHNKTKLLAKIDVFSRFEDGLLGVTLDPDFMTNGWIYIFYSAPGDSALQRVSRMKLADDSLILSTEKVLLEIPVQRETCCHSAGSLTFGKDNNLYISVGDNTSSKESDGYSPIDTRPGRSPFDAQKSSSNTHDLRGKILRIHLEKDGTYSIPDGNLFPKDGTKGRPEIYTMGCRNPFRISTNKKNGWLFWGDVGPDAGSDDKRGRGPKSYDEFNLAKAPGNFGWPYFVGNNFAYHEFDFKDSIVGKAFDPMHVVNNSPNNYGAKSLPPANPAWIWYSYDDSKEFPILGNSGRSAMAGPMYIYSDYQHSKNRFPKYYDNKVFIYEWMRDWIITVKMDAEGKIVEMEKFMPGTKFDHPIDMEIGPEGDLYMLEYGTNWFSQNEDARLVRIKYQQGNWAPTAKFNISDTVGMFPLKVEFDGSPSVDLDNDSLIYEWNFDGKEAKSKGKKTTYTFENAGVYFPKLTVTDPTGDTSSTTVKITVGNTYPKVDIEFINCNSTFFFKDKPLQYRVLVNDLEDKIINSKDIKTEITFNESSIYEALNPEKPITDHPLIAASDCKACHSSNKKSVGPSFVEIAEFYPKNPENIEKLARKIITGGSGKWSDLHAMSAHPQLTMQQTTAMVQYIFQYAGKKPDKITKPLPNSGIIDLKTLSAKNGTFTLSSTYTDKGYQGKYKFTSQKRITLIHPKTEAETAIPSSKSVGRFIGNQFKENSYLYMGGIADNSYIKYKNIDLNEISKITASVNSNQAKGEIEVRIDSNKGKVIATLPIKPTGKWEDWYSIKSKLKPIEGNHDIYFVYKNVDPKANDYKGMINIDWVEFGK
ncbi:MAG: PQQ-dependent sugar dehydrogenase [Bacteroidota bacterium]|nr:PQQ-dependent sugar dehydrogenase [Bacteroidota bacterium]